MPVITASKTSPHYDVIVVGSGAGGGQSTYTLTMAGAKVLLVEAGRNYDPGKETPMFQTNGQAPLRGEPTPDKPLGFYDSTVNGGWEVPGEPFTNASDDPAKQFTWWRPRMLGGRSNHWGRISLRNGPYDFKARQRDGLGFDWPISYEDLAPYYDRVEMLVGVYGTNEGLENTPNASPGVLLPPPAPRVGERLAQARVAKLGVPIIPARRAVLTVRQDAENIPAKLHPNNPKAQRILADAMRQRSACLWATSCGRGCSVKANYQSTTVHLPPALATGNLDILPNAMVREVTVDDQDRATGIVYIDKLTGQEGRVSARAVVLAAGSCESVRIMMNSKSARHPQGLANANGWLGKNLMDSVGAGVSGQIPLLENLPLHNEDGAGGDHLYAPWWLYREQLAGKLGFARGYHIEFSSGRKMPGLGSGPKVGTFATHGYGRGYKEEARRYYGSHITFSGRGEMIANAGSFCELDPVVKDKWGIPVLRFHWQWTQHELKQVDHMHRTFRDMIEAMGGRVTGEQPLRPGGNVKHEVGGGRMGSDPNTSVTNQWGQTWQVKNLVLCDGSPFCGNADKNPTLTIMALAWRSAEHLLESMAKGEIA